MRTLTIILALCVALLMSKKEDETIPQAVQRIGGNITWIISETFR
jgi:hypothetical protein